MPRKAYAVRLIRLLLGLKGLATAFRKQTIRFTYSSLRVPQTDLEKEEGKLAED